MVADVWPAWKRPRASDSDGPASAGSERFLLAGAWLGREDPSGEHSGKGGQVSSGSENRVGFLAKGNGADEQT